MEQVFRLRSLLTKATTTFSSVPASNHGNGRKMGEIIVKIADLEAEVNADIDTLVDLKEVITAAIKEADDPELQVLLEMRYLAHRTWEQISVAMGISIRHTYRLHDQALEKISLPAES